MFTRHVPHAVLGAGRTEMHRSPRQLSRSPRPEVWLGGSEGWWLGVELLEPGGLDTNTDRVAQHEFLSLSVPQFPLW